MSFKLNTRSYLRQSDYQLTPQQREAYLRIMEQHRAMLEDMRQQARQSTLLDDVKYYEDGYKKYTVKKVEKVQKEPDICDIISGESE